MPNDWLKTEHPLYTERRPEWERCERRFRGGLGVLKELRRFDWETGASGGASDKSDERALQAAVEARLLLQQLDDVSHFEQRQSMATYVSFPEAFAALLVGHMMRQAPEADSALKFGTLGDVARQERTTTPSQAELVYYNVDGIGNDGSMWDNFWTEVEKWAMCTGHRWMMVEARQKPTNREDEMRGRRPFLVSYSPLAVTNWHHEDGQLQMAIIKLPYREPRLDNGSFSGNETKYGHRLLTRAGFQGFGDAYEGGGWWDFDEDGNQRANRSGTWEGTKGEIPLWIHYYERDREKLSRSGVFEIGQAAIAHMNLSSAADFDAWDAASSLTWLAGVDRSGFGLAMEKVASGSRFVPLPPAEIGGDKAIVPSVSDGSQGAVTAGVFEGRLKSILEAVRELAAREVSGTPDSSGLSKQMGFQDAKSPRLSLMASEMESSQNTAIRFLELRFGKTSPSGAVKWPREFELAPVLDKLNGFLDAQETANVRSPELTARALMVAADNAGLISDDDDRKKLHDEFVKLVGDGAKAAAQERSMLGGFLGGGGAGTQPEPATT